MKLSRSFSASAFLVALLFVSALLFASALLLLTSGCSAEPTHPGGDGGTGGADLGMPSAGHDLSMPTHDDGPPPAPRPDMATPPDMTSPEGLTWPPDQQFPSFAGIGALDAIDVTALDGEHTTLVVTLAGVVNRRRPRVYTIDGGGEGKTFWLDRLGATSIDTVTDPLALVTKYKAELHGIVIYDNAQRDTLNLATTIAGLEDGIVVAPALAATLMGAPYSLPVIADLRSNHFTSNLDVYQYQLDHYAAGATDRMIMGLNPAPNGVLGSLRDYAVATRAFTVWLDPRNAAEKQMLAKYLGRLRPNSPYLGWWIDEPSGVSAAASSAVPVFAADWSSNLTVLGGTPRLVSGSAAAAPVPGPPPLDNKVYVAIFMSDGDNVQEDQHLVPIKWADHKRGTVPIGWTLDPALVDISPVILKYFQTTATQNDVLVSGPSGLGYTYPAAWPAGVFDTFAQVSGRYMAAAGLRVITVWNNGVDLSDGDAASYFNHMPNLLGLTIQDESRPLRFINNALPVVRLAISYGDTAAILESGIDNQLKSFKGSAPLFVAVQGNMNMGTIHPSAFAEVQQHYAGNANVVFVRADHFFQLVAQANLPASHRVFSDDFTGDGKSDALMYYSGDGNWWLGASDGTKLTWSNAGNSAAAGSFTDNKHVFYTGDFTGDHKADVLVYGSNDGNWRLGSSNGATLSWLAAGNTNNFGNLLDGSHRLSVGDYDGDGRKDALFYYNGNGDWFMGTSDGSKLNWHSAGNTGGYGNLLDGGHLIFDGDFTGDGKADVLMLASDGNWWMGVSDGTKLVWHLAGSSASFGNLVEGSHKIVIGDFTGDKKQDVLFYFAGDGNWWLGTSDGNQLSWHNAGQSSGDLLDWSHRLLVGDWSGDGKADVAAYDSDDTSFRVGASDGSVLGWRTPSLLPAQSNLVDTAHLLFRGDFDGDGKMDLLSYASADGGWSLGKSDGTKLTWTTVANTKGFGDLTH